jgi:D-aminopeptidase
MTRARARDLGITIGTFSPGAHNAITDVPGVWVGHKTVIRDTPAVVRTGVTVIVPREGRIHEDHPFAGYFSFNGCGEMTGLPWIEESGLLQSPIALTSTAQVGMVRDAMTRYSVERLAGRGGYWLPVAAETYDGWLNDLASYPLAIEDVYDALDSAAAGPVAEGNVGGGTGMICHDFKGGIGTSSRVVETESGRYTVGSLVQANHGERPTLRFDGVPVGREIGPDVVPTPWETPPASSSILVVLATDAPLLPVQCKRLARRATVGLARAGGTGHAFSGDLFLAFSTGNHCPPSADRPVAVHMLPLGQMDPLYDAAAAAVEESILNALTAAETMTGHQGHVAHALPLDRLAQVMAKYNRTGSPPK